MQLKIIKSEVENVIHARIDMHFGQCHGVTNTGVHHLAYAQNLQPPSHKPEPPSWLTMRNLQY